MAQLLRRRSRAARQHRRADLVARLLGALGGEARALGVLELFVAGVVVTRLGSPASAASIASSVERWLAAKRGKSRSTVKATSREQRVIRSIREDLVVAEAQTKAPRDTRRRCHQNARPRSGCRRWARTCVRWIPSSAHRFTQNLIQRSSCPLLAKCYRTGRDVAANRSARPHPGPHRSPR